MDTLEREDILSDGLVEVSPKKRITNRRVRFSDVDNNFLQTPGWGVEALLSVVPFEGRILEPSCGKGAISTVLERRGYDVVSSDLVDRGYGQTGVDFFSITDPVENIVTNPPYGKKRIADRFVLHALELATNKVAMLLRLAFLEGEWRAEHIFKDFPPTDVWVFSERLSMWWEDSGRVGEDGGTTAYAWFIWDKSLIGLQREVRFLPCGFRPRKERSKKKKKAPK